MLFSSILLKSMANRCANQNALSTGCTDLRWGPSQQLPAAIQPDPVSGGAITVGSISTDLRRLSG